MGGNVSRGTLAVLVALVALCATGRAMPASAQGACGGPASCSATAEVAAAQARGASMLTAAAPTATPTLMPPTETPWPTLTPIPTETPTATPTATLVPSATPTLAPGTTPTPSVTPTVTETPEVFAPAAATKSGESMKGWGDPAVIVGIILTLIAIALLVRAAGSFARAKQGMKR